MSLNVRDLFGPDDQKEFDALSPEEQQAVQTEFDNAASAALKPIGVVLNMANKIIDLLGTSGLLTKVAKMQRQYYLALLDEGFTHEQALALSSGLSSLLTNLKKPQ